MGGFLSLTAMCAALLALVQLITCAISLRIGVFRIVDQVWGLGLGLVAVLAGVLGGGDVTRRVVVAVLVAIWGSRLTVHIARRARGAPEDPRYQEMLAGSSTPVACLKVFGIQWIAQWFISLPVQVSAITSPDSAPLWVLVIVGAAGMVGGLIVEAVADRQMQVFKSHPGHRGTIMDRGLWSWSRHPNYFGDALFWVGVYLVAAAAWPGPLTILSPAAMVWFLVVATGARRLERHMQGRPGFAEYQHRTGFFVPRPPRPSTPNRAQ